MSALVSQVLLILIQIITVFWAKNYFGPISAWVAESEQMSGPKRDEFDMNSHTRSFGGKNFSFKLFNLFYSSYFFNQV